MQCMDTVQEMTNLRVKPRWILVWFYSNFRNKFGTGIKDCIRENALNLINTLKSSASCEVYIQQVLTDSIIVGFREIKNVMRDYTMRVSMSAERERGEMIRLQTINQNSIVKYDQINNVFVKISDN